MRLEIRVSRAFSIVLSYFVVRTFSFRVLEDSVVKVLFFGHCRMIYEEPCTTTTKLKRRTTTTTTTTDDYDSEEGMEGYDDPSQAIKGVDDIAACIRRNKESLHPKYYDVEKDKDIELFIFSDQVNSTLTVQKCKLIFRATTDFVLAVTMYDSGLPNEIELLKTYFPVKQRDKMRLTITGRPGEPLEEIMNRGSEDESPRIVKGHVDQTYPNMTVFLEVAPKTIYWKEWILRFKIKSYHYSELLDLAVHEDKIVDIEGGTCKQTVYLEKEDGFKFFRLVDTTYITRNRLPRDCEFTIMTRNSLYRLHFEMLVEPKYFLRRLTNQEIYMYYLDEEGIFQLFALYRTDVNKSVINETPPSRIRGLQYRYKNNLAIEPEYLGFGFTLKVVPPPNVTKAMLMQEIMDSEKHTPKPKIGNTITTVYMYLTLILFVLVCAVITYLLYRSLTWMQRITKHDVKMDKNREKFFPSRGSVLPSITSDSEKTKGSSLQSTRITQPSRTTNKKRLPRDLT